MINKSKKTRKKNGGNTYYLPRELTEKDYNKINQKIENHEIEEIMALYHTFLSDKRDRLYNISNKQQQTSDSVVLNDSEDQIHKEWHNEIERLVRREREYKLRFDGITNEEERKNAINSVRNNWTSLGLSGGRKKMSYKSKKSKKKTKKRKHKKTKNRRKK